MAPFSNPLIDARLEHESRTVIANGFSSSSTERMIALKIADDIALTFPVEDRLAKLITPT